MSDDEISASRSEQLWKSVMQYAFYHVDFYDVHSLFCDATIQLSDADVAGERFEVV